MRKFNRKIALKDYLEGRKEDLNCWWILLFPPVWFFLPLIIVDEIVMLCSVLINGKVEYTYGYCTIDHYEEGVKKETEKFLKEISEYEKRRLHIQTP